MKTETQKRVEMKYRREKVKQVVVTFSPKDADKALASVTGVVLGLAAVEGQRDGVGHLTERHGLLGHDDERGVHDFPVGIQGGFKDVPGVLWGFVAARRPPTLDAANLHSERVGKILLRHSHALAGGL